MSMNSTDRGLLTPANCAVAFIDHQAAFLGALSRTDRRHLLASLDVLARTAQLFELPVILTTLDAPGGDAHPLSELREVFPGVHCIVRTSMNAWDDPAFVASAARSGRRNFVLAAQLSEASLVFPALQMLEEGYGIYVVEDASRGTSRAAQRTALKRIATAGGIAITALQLLLEMQRDWAVALHREEVLALLETRYGAFGAAPDIPAGSEIRPHRAPTSNAPERPE